MRPFKQNRRIDLPNGRWRYADFLWPELRAILEIDSERHHSLPPDADATEQRHDELTRYGYDVIHRRPAYITAHPHEFVRGVVAWLDDVAHQRTIIAR